MAEGRSIRLSRLCTYFGRSKMVTHADGFAKRAAALLMLAEKQEGRYAIEFQWLDGHRSGIYSWDYLRRNCQCGPCRFERGETTGTPNGNLAGRS